GGDVVGDRPGEAAGVRGGGGDEDRGGEVVFGVLELHVGDRSNRGPRDGLRGPHRQLLPPVRAIQRQGSLYLDVGVPVVEDAQIPHVRHANLHGRGDVIRHRPGEGAGPRRRGGDQDERGEVVLRVFQAHIRDR